MLTKLLAMNADYCMSGCG